MKKYIYSIFAAAALFGFSACDDGDYTDWAAPMHAEQEEVTAAVDASATPVATTIDWSGELGETVQVVTASATSGYDARYELAFTNGTVLNVDANGCVNTDELKGVVENLFGKAPVEREVNATLIAYITVDNVTVKKEIPVAIKAKLLAPVIYKQLYIIGAPSEWNPSCTALPFKHSGKDVYEDPIFTVTFPVADGDTWFAVADSLTVATGEWSNVFGAKEGNGMNLVGEAGMIARRSELSDDGSFKVTVKGDAKYIKMTCNMLDGTYLIEKVNFVPYLYFIGATDGWKNAEQRLAHQGDGLYTGYCYVADPNGWGIAFKFQQEAGNWDTQVNAGSFTTMEGVSGTDNIEAASEGVYYFEADLANSSIKATKVTCMGLIGGFNEWKADDEMTWDAANLCYVKTGATVTTGGWKFRINNDWPINLGGTADNLVGNGANLEVAGTTIKLYPCRTTSDNIYCTVE